MVRTIHTVVMPMSGGTLRLSNRKHINGRGNGSVLLDGGQGGPGSGSSYSSLDDYINTTGLNPYVGEPRSAGRGLSSMNSKLEHLLVKSNKKKINKEKNINFNL